MFMIIVPERIWKNGKKNYFFMIMLITSIKFINDDCYLGI